MGAGNLIEIARVRDAEGCRELLDRARQHDSVNNRAKAAAPVNATSKGSSAEAQRQAALRSSMLLQTVASLLHDFGRMRVTSEESFEILEQIRSAAIEGFDKLRFVSAPNEGVPITSEQWEPRRRVMLAYKALCNHYKRIYTSLLEDEGLQTRTVIPGTANSLRTVMPLARALDCQSRYISFALMQQMSPSKADWNELCVMAQHLRLSTFLDEALPDSSAMIRPNTGRAMFVYTQLLGLARPFGRPQIDMMLIEKLARKWAAKVGFRIDRGALRKDNAQGPSLVLTSEHVVRLDTHKLVRSLLERRSELADPMALGVSGLPNGLSSTRLLALFDELELCWGKPGWQEVSVNISADAVDANAVFGFAVPGQSARRETVTFDVMKSTVFRQVPEPSCLLGSVIAIAAEKARPSELIVGVVTEAAQLLDTELSPPRTTRISFNAWPDKGRAVTVLWPDSQAYEPAYCLFHEHTDARTTSSDTGLDPTAVLQGTSLLVPSGRCPGLPCEVLVRDSGGVVKAQLGLKLAGNSRFDRFVMRML